MLQTGIVCVAAKLSFFELLSTGSSGIPVVLGAVGAGLVTIPMMGTLAGLPRKMSLLLTAGTSICGVTAITALAPAIEAEKRDVAVAVANTVAFGTVGMLAYPYIFNALCTSSEQVGMCLGVAIHDTSQVSQYRLSSGHYHRYFILTRRSARSSLRSSQVLGSAMSYRETFDDEIALRVAAVTKLTRNLGLAVAIPMLTFIHKKEVGAGEVKSSDEDTMSGLATFKKYVPPFLVAFIGMAGLRSTGDLIMDPAVNQLYFEAVSFVGSDLSKYALGTAMAGVGLSTDAGEEGHNQQHHYKVFLLNHGTHIATAPLHSVSQGRRLETLCGGRSRCADSWRNGLHDCVNDCLNNKM